jgi:hypothetical protein
LLEEVAAIQKEHAEKNRENGVDFNLFEMLNAPINETKLTKYLLYLLHPQGMHGQGIKPLQALVSALPVEGLDSSIVELLRKPIQGLVSVKLEEDIGDIVEKEGKEHYGRIDLIFKWPGVALIIENKPYARDQKKQLERYFQAYENNKVHPPIIIYLTKYGQPPNDYTLGECPIGNVISLSYNNLFQYLNKYSESLPDNNLYRASLKQFALFLSSKLGYLSGDFVTMENKLFELLLQPDY